MIYFDPPELREQLGRIVKEFKVGIRLDDPDLEEPLAGDPESADYVVTADYGAYFSVTATEDGFSLTVGQLVDLADELRTATLLGPRSTLRTSLRTVMRLEPTSEGAEALWFAGPPIEAKQMVESNGLCLELRLVDESLPFTLMVANSGAASEANPSAESTNSYVEVLHPEKTDPRLVANAVEAFLFELSSSYGLDYRVASHPDAWDGWPELEEFENEGRRIELRVRPLDVSGGLPDLYRLFSRAVGANDLEYRIVGFVKVIEHVSGTVVRRTAHGALRTHLLSGRALAPDATFLDELTSVVDTNRALRKDSEALKLAIQTCCTSAELERLAPPCLQTKDRGFHSTRKANESLADLAECCSATRNQLVHGKATYAPTGRECPEAELPVLEACLRQAAIQCIRWFASLAEHARVVQRV